MLVAGGGAGGMAATSNYGGGGGAGGLVYKTNHTVTSKVILLVLDLEVVVKMVMTEVITEQYNRF